MATVKTQKPDLLQVFDKYLDREYYKIVGGAILSSERKVRTDRLKTEKEWYIDCDKMPDKIFVNGNEVKLQTLI